MQIFIKLTYKKNKKTEKENTFFVAEKIVCQVLLKVEGEFVPLPQSETRESKKISSLPFSVGVFSPSYFTTCKKVVSFYKVFFRPEIPPPFYSRRQFVNF